MVLNIINDSIYIIEIKNKVKQYCELREKISYNRKETGLK